MDQSTLKTIVSHIHRKFPEFSDSQPKVRVQERPQSKSISANPTFLLTFHSTAKTGSLAAPKSLPRWMRVVVDSQGKIIKITTSR